MNSRQVQINMNESVHLIVRFLFIDISLPVLSVAPTPHAACSCLARARVKSHVEYLSEYGDVVRDAVSDPSVLDICVYSDKNYSERPWVADFEFLDYTAGGQEEKTLENNPDTSAQEHAAPAAVYSFYKPQSTNENKPDLTSSDNGAGAPSATHSGKDAGPRGASHYVALSPANSILFAILQKFSPIESTISYHYTEFDSVPLFLQILLHVPLILTGLVIFLVIFTLDPDFQASMLKKEIDKLPAFQYAEDMQLADCSVCLDGYASAQELRRLRCNHVFHKACIDSWLLQNPKCPICRDAVASAPTFPHYNEYIHV
ncbi:hypothetical protein PAPHI01_1625 [Pancytospora philotis]|nr:hypothetical protein PAPHI01_1625 [Pancytospora philotis]